MSKSIMQAATSWFLRLREDALSDVEMSQWIEWCEADQEHLRTFEEVQALWRDAGEHAPSPQVLAQLMSSSDAPPQVNRNQAAAGRRSGPVQRGAAMRAGGPNAGTPFGIVGLARATSRRHPAWAAAASFVVAIAVFGLWWGVHGGPRLPSDSSVAQLAAVGSVNTPAAQNRQGVLPDGSHVDLGARTVLDVDFSDLRRQLELRDGQAFFQVMHDKTRPFVVSVGEIQIVAIGTAFDVRRTAAQVAVTVQEGTVQMIRAGGEPLTATAGYQLIFSPASGKVHKSLVDPAVALAWRSGRLEFTGDPLEVVIASVNRYASQPIVLGDPTLGKLTFTGTVFTQSIDASLDAMEQVFPIHIERTPTQTLFTRK